MPLTPAEARRALLRHRRRVARLSRDPRARSFRDRAPASTYAYLVHLHTYPGRLGSWRMTYFVRAEHGGYEPVGHADGGSYAQALEAAHEYGADLGAEVAIP